MFWRASYNHRIYWSQDNRYIAFEDEEVLSINATESKCITVSELTEGGTGSQKTYSENISVSVLLRLLGNPRFQP